MFIKNNKYTILSNNIFVGKFISEERDYYIFEDIISNEHVSVKKDIKIKNYKDNSILFSVYSDLIEAIISRRELIDNYTKLDKNSVLISIREPGSVKIDLNYFSSELYIDFYDITSNIGSIKIISDKKAKIIKNFILKNKNKRFVINCEAGQSRSAGVGLAIECILRFGGNIYNHSTSFSEIKDHPRYFPNLIVYQKIINIS